MPVLPAERRRAIIDRLLVNSSISSNDLALEFGVSKDTIRRDLRLLAADGLVSRTHGGAIWSDARELVFGVHNDPYLAAKRAIAHKALDFIRPGDIIALDMGRTAVQMARAIYNTTRRRPITVFTCDLRVGLILGRAKNIEVNITGGVIGRRNYIRGPYTTGFFASLASDTLFLTASGISTEGIISEPLEDVAEIKKAMLKKAKRTILLADHSKFHKSYAHNIATLQQIDTIITDRKCPAETLALLQELGLQYFCA